MRYGNLQAGHLRQILCLWLISQAAMHPPLSDFAIVNSGVAGACVPLMRGSHLPKLHQPGQEIAACVVMLTGFYKAS